MHSRLVCGESTAFGLLATRDPGSSSEEARAVPLSGGGAARVSEEERIQGGGEEGWQYSQLS